jgi:hypothetical protein
MPSELRISGYWATLPRHLVHSWSTPVGTAWHNLTPAPAGRTVHQIGWGLPARDHRHGTATTASDGTFATAIPTAGS